MIKKIKLIKLIKQNNDGMTMVEVLMGFLILSIILGGVVTLITFSSNMYFQSIDARNEQTKLAEEAYKKAPAGSDVNVDVFVLTTPGEVGTASKVTLNGADARLKSMSLVQVSGNEQNAYVFVALDD